MSKLLSLIVFTSGAVVMILELTGSRILAPYIGSSLPVWTSLIGIILGSLSLGYIFGGKLADKEPSYEKLMKILLAGGLTIAVIPFLSKELLTIISTIPDIRVSAVLASLLFVPASIILGMVSPYAVRLAISKISNSGETVGKLYALSTIGSIFGTFLTGFYLLAVFSSSTILYLLVGVLLTLSIFIMVFKKTVSKSLLALVSVSLLLAYLLELTGTKLPGREVNTLYNHVRIIDYTSQNGEIREMIVGTSNMSAFYLDNNDLVYPYTKYYRLADHYAPPVRHALMIGGAGFSFPKEFIATHPTGMIDVVEIDSGLTKIAQEYFYLEPSSRMMIYHEDARTFLNRTTKKYDAIYMDAFGTSHAIPFQLTTREAVLKMYDALDDDGVIITNTISAVTGNRGKFLRAEYLTYKSVFPHVAVFPVSYPTIGEGVQNIMLIASKKPLTSESEHEATRELLSHEWKEEIVQDQPILTDEYAPVEQYELAFYE